MNRCLAFLLALLFATVSVSSACVAAPSDAVHFMLEPERGDSSRIHVSFRDQTRDRDQNSWSSGFTPSELIGLDVSSFRASGTRPLRFAIVREAGRLDCSGNGGDSYAAGNCDAARDARQEAVDQAREATGEARDAVREKMLGNGRIDQIIAMKAAGVSPEYVNALRAVQPRLRALDPANFAGMKSIGVTSEFARELAAAGFNNLDANGLAEARAVGLSGEYARAMRNAGLPLDLEQYIQLRAVGVSPAYVLSIRRSAHSAMDAHRIVQMWAYGVRPADLGVAPPTPPRPPKLPPKTGRPAASPPDWNDPDGG
jgi:hypothetical protein